MAAAFKTSFHKAVVRTCRHNAALEAIVGVAVLGYDAPLTVLAMVNSNSAFLITNECRLASATEFDFSARLRKVRYLTLSVGFPLPTRRFVLVGRSTSGSIANRLKVRGH